MGCKKQGAKSMEADESRGGGGAPCPLGVREVEKGLDRLLREPGKRNRKVRGGKTRNMR